MARKPKLTPTLQPVLPESVAPVQSESAGPEPGPEPTLTSTTINLKKATREYGAELCDLCPPSSHAALLAKLEHVRENAELAIRG